MPETGDNVNISYIIISHRSFHILVHWEVSFIHQQIFMMGF